MLISVRHMGSGQHRGAENLIRAATVVVDALAVGVRNMQLVATQINLIKTLIIHHRFAIAYRWMKRSVIIPSKG